MEKKRKTNPKVQTCKVIEIKSSDLKQVALKSYGSLSFNEKVLLQLIALHYYPIELYDLNRCAGKAGLKSDNGKRLPNYAISDALSFLKSKKMVGYEYGAVLFVLPPFNRIAIRDARTMGTYTRLVEVVKDAQRFSYGYRKIREVDLLGRDAWFAWSEKRFDDLEQLLDRYRKVCKESYLPNPLDALFLVAPDLDEISVLPGKIQADLLASLVFETTHFCLNPVPLVSYAQESLARFQPEHQGELREVLSIRAIYQGQLEKAETWLEGQNSSAAVRIRAWILFLRGKTDEAIAAYEQLIETEISAQKGRKHRFVLWNDLAGAHYPLALLTTGRKDHQARAEEMLKEMSKIKQAHPVSYLYVLLEALCKSLHGQEFDFDRLDNAELLGPVETVDCFFQYLPVFWAVPKRVQKDLAEETLNAQRRFASCGYRWLELEMKILRLGASKQVDEEKAREALADLGFQSLATRYKSIEPWERSLNALTALYSSSAVATPVDAPKPLRVAWRFEFDSYNPQLFSIAPLEQKRLANGGWTKGRPIAIKRLTGRPQDDFPYFTEQDWQVCQNIVANQVGNGWGYRTEYWLDDVKAVKSLVGHPNLYHDETPIELVRGEPLLQVTQQGKSIEISLWPTFPERLDGCLLDRETPTRFRVIEVTEPLRQLAGILKKSLKVPASARERVLETIAGIAHIATVHSDVGGDFLSDLPVEEVPTDSRPLVHLLPDGQGLKVELFVRPFGEKGPCHHPGVGGEVVLAEVDGKRMRVKRDLGGERLRAAQVVERCPVLNQTAEGDFRWTLDDPEECLETLLALQELGDQATLEWPQGGRMRVQTGNASAFQGAIRSQREWFSASGEMRVDNDLVLNLRQLIELTEASAGRFVPLGEGRFLALTREFRRRLDELRFLGEVHGEEVRISPLAALAFEEASNGLGKIKTDKKWKEALSRVEEAMARTLPVPGVLQAELRDYQIEGYQWLDRLAHWGVGACLADDMGLGKTLQALTLILSRTAAGPALVVAPTSVCLNWMAETLRFAPTLNPVVFGAGDRKQTLEDLKPGDLLLVTYTLLQQEADLFAEREWGTVVLDEAQAIKNMATRRSKAAMRLKTGFRMITTGTPIENHLGELWNLFRFINPGLLGSLERFNTRFATPIERDRNKEARLRLKKLIQPFILRRTKSQVLEELPARTEIVRHVTLSPQETAFYEALRLKAIEAIEANPEETGQKRFRVLAEIMRLRRACCNVELVTPGLNLPSSRLAVFGELIDELIEGNHKALVFSQFVDHLTLIRASLDEKKIAYQYLDGSTPAAERKKRVDAFQNGEGDVFLISLRAGGLGLNLTAADYVIHMDPWWNPAVEDQASDRAHRIGQQRPVTIYRLIAENTIEQKIVALHEHKRDLADGLLDGTDMGTRISTEDLVQIIRESAAN